MRVRRAEHIKQITVEQAVKNCQRGVDMSENTKDDKSEQAILLSTKAV